MVDTIWQHETPEEIKSSETIKSPDINFLREGTRSYSIDIYEKDIYGEQDYLSENETQGRINTALDKINKQWGKLIKILELDVKWESWVGMMGEPPKQKCLLFVVNKEKAKER